MRDHSPFSGRRGGGREPAHEPSRWAGRRLGGLLLAQAVALKTVTIAAARISTCRGEELPRCRLIIRSDVRLVVFLAFVAGSATAHLGQSSVKQLFPAPNHSRRRRSAALTAYTGGPHRSRRRIRSLTTEILPLERGTRSHRDAARPDTSGKITGVIVGGTSRAMAISRLTCRVLGDVPQTGRHDPFKPARMSTPSRARRSPCRARCAIRCSRRGAPVPHGSLPHRNDRAARTACWRSFLILLGIVVMVGRGGPAPAEGPRSPRRRIRLPEEREEAPSWSEDIRAQAWISAWSSRSARLRSPAPQKRDAQIRWSPRSSTSDSGRARCSRSSTSSVCSAATCRSSVTASRGISSPRSRSCPPFCGDVCTAGGSARSAR